MKNYCLDFRSDVRIFYNFSLQLNLLDELKLLPYISFANFLTLPTDAQKKREKYAYKTILIIHHVAWASHIIFLTTIIDGGGKNLIKMKPKFNIFALTSISSFHMGENAGKLNWLQLWAAIVNILLFLLIAVWEFAVTKRKKKLIEEAFFGLKVLNFQLSQL